MLVILAKVAIYFKLHMRKVSTNYLIFTALTRRENNKICLTILTAKFPKLNFIIEDVKAIS
ncbi:hypothetical protein KAOT1_10011 [Kordia algicida OT-1]|uniref:Uncharacterized protein n=1 Tax=Kordia algicida OT-1 TaxID=391587 RepID=A9ECJ7_9FLAO|nr:hypothetical protein KAOT1_10011 [Kordia algicida OT-1]